MSTVAMNQEYQHSPTHPPSLPPNPEMFNNVETKDHNQRDEANGLDTPDRDDGLLPCTTVHKTSAVKKDLLFRQPSVVRAAIAQVASGSDLGPISRKTPTAPTCIPARSGEVKLIRSSALPLSQYGKATCARSYTIIVRNLGYEKLVVLRGKDTHGKYCELHASYSSSVADNCEVWQAVSDDEQGFASYTVNLLVNGFEYVDDNSGKLFSDSNVKGIQLHSNTFVRRWIASTLQGRHPTVFEVGAHVQNLSFNKVVEVWYTTDGWLTTHVAPLKFVEREFYGNGYVTSPNSVGVEYWNSGVVQVGDDVSVVNYCIRYKCDQGEYWDNNWGNNYEANRLLSNVRMR